ncbi:hypothetical protein ZWY2020_012236 [Hordeum vulgare]|nr:hypothetical protein ZWY2020_012236 [Hordeum vulgare]
MGMTAADAGDPGREEQLLPAVPPLLGDSAVPPELRHSPCGWKAASMEALVPVEGGEHGGREDLIPAFSRPRDGSFPKPPSLGMKAISMAKRPATVAEEQDVHDDEPIANYKR